MRAIISPDARAYSYAGMGGANPDAVTKIMSGASGTTYAYDLNGNLASAGNRVSTTTFQFDKDGNVTQKPVDGTTTTYLYDYANRFIAIDSRGAATGDEVAWFDRPGDRRDDQRKTDIVSLRSRIVG
jgi:uncharacterized protein RhaS with RHS repeats